MDQDKMKDWKVNKKSENLKRPDEIGGGKQKLTLIIG
jgi:hypothetical protein